MNFLKKTGAVFVVIALVACMDASAGKFRGKKAKREPERVAELDVAALRELAARIEDVVRRRAREEEVEAPEGISIDSPEVRQAIRTRAARRVVVDQFMDTGFAWERLDGLVHIRRSAAYKASGNRMSRDREAMIIISENNDRWTLYEGIVKENRLPRKALDVVKSVFADARVVGLAPGQLFENRDGEAVSR